MADSCYIIVKFDPRVVQFDFCIGKEVHNYNFKGDNKQKVNSFGEGSFGVYVDLVGTYPKLYSLLNATSEYPCSACACLDTYYFNASTSTCAKNISIAYTPTTIDPATINLTNFQVSQQILNNTNPLI